jgi:hypothetical protein
MLSLFNKKKTLFTSTLDLNLRKKLVNCNIWSIALYGAEMWTLRKVLKCGAGEEWRSTIPSFTLTVRFVCDIMICLNIERIFSR